MSSIEQAVYTLAQVHSVAESHHQQMTPCEDYTGWVLNDIGKTVRKKNPSLLTCSARIGQNMTMVLPLVGHV